MQPKANTKATAMCHEQTYLKYYWFVNQEWAESLSFTVAPQHWFFRVFRILSVLFLTGYLGCLQRDMHTNIEATTALNKQLVALDVSLANCMAEHAEMKVRSTYFVLKLVTFRLICRFFSQQYEIQLCKGCRTFRISSNYLFFMVINFLRWCQTYFLLKIKVNNLS